MTSTTETPVERKSQTFDQSTRLVIWWDTWSPTSERFETTEAAESRLQELLTLDNVDKIAFITPA